MAYSSAAQGAGSKMLGLVHSQADRKSVLYCAGSSGLDLSLHQQFSTQLEFNSSSNSMTEHVSVKSSRWKREQWLPQEQWCRLTLLSPQVSCGQVILPNSCGRSSLGKSHFCRAAQITTASWPECMQKRPQKPHLSDLCIHCKLGREAPSFIWPLRYSYAALPSSQGR